MSHIENERAVEILEAVKNVRKEFQSKRDEIYEMRERERNRPKSMYQPLGTSPLEATLNDILEAYDFILKELRQIPGLEEASA